MFHTGMRMLIGIHGRVHAFPLGAISAHVVKVEGVRLHVLSGLIVNLLLCWKPSDLVQQLHVLIMATAGVRMAFGSMASAIPPRLRYLY